MVSYILEKELKIYDVDLFDKGTVWILAEDLEQAVEKADQTYGSFVMDVRRSPYSLPVVPTFKEEVNQVTNVSHKERSPINFRSDVVVHLEDSMGSDQSIVDAARVSTGSSGSEKANVGLLNMLMRDRHGSPFEQVTFTFYIEAPIFVARQYFRHRVASYNEESGRYRELQPDFYLPGEERLLRQEGKPAQYTYVKGSLEDYQSVRSKLIGNSTVAYQSYLEMLDSGIAREVARMVLPLNLYTRFYVTMNARAMMNFLSLRKIEDGAKFDSNPQSEIDMVATEMSNLARGVIPRTMEAFEKHGFVAP